MEGREMQEFDLTIHLAGEQSIPNYMGIRMIKAPRHLLVVTSRTKKQTEILKKVLAEFTTDCPEVYDLEMPSAKADEIAIGMAREVEEFKEKHPGARIAFNVTGGTKMMSLAAFKVAMEKNATVFYVDTENKKLNRLKGESFTELELPKVFSSVKEFVLLSNYELNAEGKLPAEILSDARRRFLHLAWRNLPVMKVVMDDFASVNAIGVKSEKRKAKFDAAVKRFAELSSGNVEFCEAWEKFKKELGKYRDVARFLGGVWIEQWLLARFDESTASRQFIDLRNGVSIRPPIKENGEKTSPLQEIDLAFTDGYNLYQIECKAPAVTQAYIHKLESNRRGIGGLFGVGLLTSLEFPENDQKVEALKERVKDSSLSFIYSEALPDLPQHIFDVKRKSYYTDWNPKSSD